MWTSPFTWILILAFLMFTLWMDDMDQEERKLAAKRAEEQPFASEVYRALGLTHEEMNFVTDAGFVFKMEMEQATFVSTMGMQNLVRSSHPTVSIVIEKNAPSLTNTNHTMDVDLTFEMVTMIKLMRKE